MELILKKGGDIVLKIHEAKEVYKEVLFTEDKNPLSLLLYPIILEEGYTVRDLFKMVEKYCELQLIDNLFPYYVNEYVMCDGQGCVTKDMLAVTIQKTFVLNEDDLDEVIDVGGRGSTDDYAIDFTPLKELLDVPLILDKWLIFTVATQTKKYLEKSYTLWEVLSSFIYEIGFYGKPEDRDREFALVSSTVEEVKKSMAEDV